MGRLIRMRLKKRALFIISLAVACLVLVTIALQFGFQGGGLHRRGIVPAPSLKQTSVPLGAPHSADLRTPSPAGPTDSGHNSHDLDPSDIDTYPEEDRAAAIAAKGDEIAESQKRYLDTYAFDPEMAERSLQGDLDTRPYIKRHEIFTPQFMALLADRMSDEEKRAEAYIRWLLGQGEKPTETPPNIFQARLTARQRLELIGGYAEVARSGEDNRTYEIACLLAKTNDSTAVGFLREELVASDALAAREAARALCRIGDPSGVRDLMSLFDGTDSLVNHIQLLDDFRAGVAAVRRVPANENPLSTPAKDPVVEEAAQHLAHVLGITGDPQARLAIVTILRWDDPIQERGIIDCFDNDTDERVREGIVQHLPTGGKTWPPSVMDFVLSRAAGPDPVVRRILVPALAGVSHSDASARALLLRIASSDPDQAVREEAQAELDSEKGIHPSTADEAPGSDEPH